MVTIHIHKHLITHYQFVKFLFSQTWKTNKSVTKTDPRQIISTTKKILRGKKRDL